MQFSTSQETQLARPFQIVPVAVLPAIAVEGARSDDHALEVVQSQMLRLRRVVEDMFMLAQADSGIYAASKTTFYLDEVVLESVRAGRVLGNVRGVQVSVGNIAPEAD